MSRCELRPAAEEDLESIADYIAEDNPSRAVHRRPGAPREVPIATRNAEERPGPSGTGTQHPEPSGQTPCHLLLPRVRRS